RLEAAGHAGAARLLKRVLYERHSGALELDDDPRLLALAREFRPAARYKALQILMRVRVMGERADPEALCAWLERAGGECASIAAAMRELGIAGLDGRDMRTVLDRVDELRRRERDERRSAALPDDLVAEVGL